MLIQTELLQCSPSDQETSGVCSSPVSQTMFDPIALEFVGIGSAEDLVARDLGGDDLANDVAIGEADDKAVFGRIVLVLCLRDQALAGIVVGLAMPAAFVLDLVTAAKQGQ